MAGPDGRWGACFALFWGCAWLTLSGGPAELGRGAGQPAAAAAASSIITRVVRTKYGDLTGTIVTPSGRYLDAVEVYRGVPYAAPPVGTLRFMPPVSGALWTGVKMADRFAPVCPQRLPDVADEEAAVRRMSKGRVDFLKRLLPYLRNQSEDCLYLNVYAPTQGTYVERLEAYVDMLEIDVCEYREKLERAEKALTCQLCYEHFKTLNPFFLK